MRMVKASSILVAVAAISVTARAQATAVPISYSTQNRSVSATSSATGFARGGTSSAPVTDNQSETQQSGGFGDFTGAAAASSTIGTQSASSSAMQQSSLDDTGFSASGSVVADSVLGAGEPANSTSNSVFQITFNVSQAEGYTFTANLDSPGDPGDPSATSAVIELTKKSGKDVFTPITSVNVSNLQTTGVLKPGTYSFDLDVAAASGDANKNFVNYSIALDDGPLATGPGAVGGPVSTATPLPSSAVMSLLMLGTLGAAEWVRRKRRAWTPM